jgi:proteasome alpha subunit
MMTPYDWQEGIGHRAQYVESRLATGVPVVAVSLDAGLLAVTFRRQSRKIYEVYDRLMFAGLGLQSDVEALRVAAIDFSHQEGFQRSEQDVTIQRVVAAVSEPVKRAFADFGSPPVVAKTMFMQVGEAPELDRYYHVDYHGDFSRDRGACFLCGNAAAHEVIERGLVEMSLERVEVEEAVNRIESLILRSLDPEGTVGEDKAAEGLTLEAGIMARNVESQRVFTLLHGDWD